MSPKNFKALLLLARPAAGKSEIIRFLKNTSLDERRSRFHVGELEEVDDFPMLYAWFEEDDILQQMGKPRLHSTPDGDFNWNYLWDVLIRRIGLDYHKLRKDHSSEGATTLVEFARGTEHGGFKRAFEQLSGELAQDAAILYVNVSYAESLRKNRLRFNPDKPYSILEHGLSDEKMEHLYRDSDWEELTGGSDQGFLTIQGKSVPFVVFDNEDDLTSPGGPALGQRLEETLARLWQLYCGESSLK